MNGGTEDISGTENNKFIQARSGEQSNRKKTKGVDNIDGNDMNGGTEDISGTENNKFIQARSGEQSNRQKTKGVDDKISAYQTNSFFQLGLLSKKKTSIVAVSSDKLKQRISHKKNSDALRPMDGLNPRSFSTKQTSAKPNS